MGQRSRLILIYAPPVLLGLVALVAFPILRTGDVRADNFRIVRGGLIGLSICYTVIVAFVRMLIGLGTALSTQPEQRGFEVTLEVSPRAAPAPAGPTAAPSSS